MAAQTPFSNTRAANHGNCCRTLYLLLPRLEPFGDGRRTCISGIGRLHCDASFSACLDLCGAPIWICRSGFPGNHVCRGGLSRAGSIDREIVEIYLFMTNHNLTDLRN